MAQCVQKAKQCGKLNEKDPLCFPASNCLYSCNKIQPSSQIIYAALICFLNARDKHESVSLVHSLGKLGRSMFALINIIPPPGMITSE